MRLSACFSMYYRVLATCPGTVGTGSRPVLGRSKTCPTNSMCRRQDADTRTFMIFILFTTSITTSPLLSNMAANATHTRNGILFAFQIALCLGLVSRRRSKRGELFEISSRLFGIPIARIAIRQSEQQFAAGVDAQAIEIRLLQIVNM